MTNSQEEKHSNSYRMPRHRTVKTASEDADTETDTDEEEVDKIRAGLNVSVTPEYMQISKLIKYAKRGNQTATVLALVALKDFDLHKQSIQSSLIHLDAVSLFVNLLQSNDTRAMIAALKILSMIACNKLVAEVIIRLNGVEVLVQHLDTVSDEVSTMSADVISDIACSRRARKQVRKAGGLHILLKICQNPALELDVAPSRQNSTRSTRRSAVRSRYEKHRQSSPEIPLEKVRAAANALWKCCKSEQNRKIIASSNVRPYLIRLIETIKDERLQMPAIGIIHCCSVEANFREQVLSSGLLSHVVKAMKSDNREFQILALKAYSVYGDEAISRDQIRELDGLDVIDSLLHKGLSHDVDLLIAATHAMWMSIKDNGESVNWFKSRSIVQDLSNLLQHSNNEVIVNSLGILSEFASHDIHNCKLLLDKQIIQLVIKHLETTDSQIIMAASRAVESTSRDEETRRTIIGDDGFRFLWSHLRSRNEKVVATALDAIFDIVQNPEETATTVRSFLGGLEVLITLMKSKNPKICKSACRVVSRVALDKENLEVLDDYDLSCIIIYLCNTKDEELQRALCSCIVSYAIDDEYRQKLRDTIPFLGQWLTSLDFSVKRHCTHALYKLSFNRENSLLIYQKGAVKHLMSLITCDDENLQESAAECVRNIRLTTVHAVEGHTR